MKHLMIVGTGVLVALISTAGTAMGQRGWQDLQCDLSTGHYLVNSAQLYLKNAATTRYQDQRERDLRDAHRVLMQALDQGRDDDPAVWYFLGRWYKVHDDYVGMDSAFDRAQALKPDCRDDIRVHRREVWVPILNRGVEAMQSSNPEAAKEYFNRALQIYAVEPWAHYYLAQLYAQENTLDSAVAYYGEAISIASDSANLEDERLAEVRERSVFNVARLYHRAEQWDSAAAWYGRYLDIDPNDAQALTGMATALTAAGRPDEAIAMYDTVLARAESLPPFELFQAGVALFNADRYERAASAFETAVERNPHFRQRETLFNLANTYLSLGNADTTRRTEMAEKMQPVAERLVEIDPASVAAKRLLAAVFQLRRLSDSTLAILEQAQAQPFDLIVSTFSPVGGGLWDVRGIITNNAESGPVTVPEIVFEFIDNEGNAVVTQSIPSQTLEEGGLAPFRMTPQGESIVGWRYRIDSAS